MNCSPDDDADIWFNVLDEKTIDVVSSSTTTDENSSPYQDTENFHDRDDATNDDLNNVNGVEQIFVEDIIKKNPNELKAVQIMQYEYSLVQFIRGLIDGNQPNKIRSIKKHDLIDFDKMADIIEYLKWISESCKVLAGRIGQELITYGQTEMPPKIIRSSYNFCSRYTKCKSFYNFERQVPVTCDQHHFVHAILKNDVDSIISYLSYVLINRTELSLDNVNDFQLSIKTIGFVTKHMAKEICLIDIKTKNNSELYHRNSAPKKVKPRHVPIKQHCVEDESKNVKSSDYVPRFASYDSRTVYRSTSAERKGSHKRPTPLENHNFSNRFEILNGYTF